MAVPVYRVHQFDIKRRTQQFTKWETAWEYIVAACIGLAGAIWGGVFGWMVERHLADFHLILFWLALPFIGGGVVLIYWHRWLKRGVEAVNLKALLVNLDAVAANPNAVAAALATYPNAVKRSRTDLAAWLVALMYWAVGIWIATADAIYRLAAEVELPTDTIIVLVLIGILGWVFWVYFPRQRARKA